jgi:broad-specificity NMP kinase
LVPDVLREGEPDFVAVVRCEPAELKSRLSARGYSHEKVLENVEAELIGVVLDASVRAFGAGVVREYDTTGSKPASVARRIADDYAAKAVHEGPWIDWTLDYDSSTKLRSLLSTPRTEPAST